MTRISSLKNPKIQQIRALLNQRQEREQAGKFVIEGVRLTEEALAAGWLPDLILISPSLSARGKWLVEEMASRGVPIEELEERTLNQLSDTQSSQGILAVLPKKELPLPPGWDLLLVADGLRDPGNLGTILRSAAAAGVQAVLTTSGTTDPFAPKVVRAGMGAHFSLPLITSDWVSIRRLAAQRPARILIADSAGGESLWQADLREPLVLVVGGEAEGAQPGAYAGTHNLIHIPMPGKSESLNVSVAASILLFEIVRQRSK